MIEHKLFWFLKIQLKKTSILFIFFGGNFLYCQQIIQKPDPTIFRKEKFDIEFLLNCKEVIPKLSLRMSTDLSPIMFQKEKNYKGLMVYSSSTTNNLTPGYYFWDGYMWIQAPKAQVKAVTTNIK